jgi:uncharacterized protein YcgL (UPF0745 family)
MTQLVRIYKGERKPDAYLYVDFSDDLARVPEVLLNQFGNLTEVMLLKLDAGRQLARADAVEVLKQIESNGFYLQLPPPDSDQMQPFAESKAASALTGSDP